MKLQGYVFHRLWRGALTLMRGVNPMIDLIDNRTLMIIQGCTALVLVGILDVRWAMIPAQRQEARRRQLMAVNEVTRNWRVTWKINAVTNAWVMAIWRRGKPDALLRQAWIAAANTPASSSRS